MACEASEVNQEELKFLRDRGWSGPQEPLW